MAKLIATQMSNEATHMSQQDVDTVKARAEIRDAIKAHRKTDDKGMRRMLAGFAVALAGLGTVAAVNDDPKDNEVIPLTVAMAGATMAGAIAAKRKHMEKELKVIEETKAGKKASVHKDEVFRNAATFAEMFSVCMMLPGVIGSSPAVTLIAASIVVGAEAAKRGLVNTERKELEQNLGRNMPAGYRMYKQNTR